MSEANKEVIRTLYGEVMAAGNAAIADEIFHPDYVDHMPIMETPDREGLLKSVEAARRAFPDVKPRIIAEIAEGDWVAIAVEADGGKHQAEYMGVPATGRPVTWTETHFWRVVDGKIREHYGNVSMFEIHRMIGSHGIDETLA
jgi:predicted ester cyclase